VLVDDSMRYVAVGLGAVLGANLRYLVTNWAIDQWGAGFPYGTLLINVSGAFLIGVLASLLARSLELSPLWRLFFVSGFLGGFTTFSAFAYEVLSLVEDGAWTRAVVYVVGSNVLGLLAVWIGSSLVGGRTTQ
jgi:CrcB protein